MPVPKIKHDWYQTDSHVIVTILVKNAENVKVACENNAVCILLLFIKLFILGNKHKISNILEKIVTKSYLANNFAVKCIRKITLWQ